MKYNEKAAWQPGVICENRSRLIALGGGCVVAVARGGTELGQKVADALRLPLLSLDVCYPLTRIVRKRKWLVPLTFLLKELAYRFTEPVAMDAEISLREVVQFSGNVLLVDDSASSCRTLHVCFRALFEQGISRERVRVVVGRVGKKAASHVDVCLYLSNAGNR